MLTFLDLFIIVAMSLIAISLVSILVMFIVKNEKVKRICFYLIAALGMYMGYVGFRINWPGFASDYIVAILMAMVSIIAFVLAKTSKDNKKRFLIAQIMASVALVLGTCNAFF